MRRVRWGHRLSLRSMNLLSLHILHPTNLVLYSYKLGPGKGHLPSVFSHPPSVTYRLQFRAVVYRKHFGISLMVPQDERGREPCDLSAETTHSSLEKKQRAGALTWVKLHRCLGLGMYSPPFLSFQTRESYWQKLYLKTNAIVQS